jgi:hypothetical protein
MTQTTPPTHSRTAFSMTPEQLVEQVRHLFVSERFAEAFEILGDSLSESSPAQLLSILNGTKTLKSNSKTDSEGNISIDIVSGDDDEYQQMCKEVLENYDFLVKINNKLHQVTRCQPFDLSLISTQNVLVNDFKTNEGEPVNLSRHRFTDSLIALQGKMSYVMEAPFVVYLNGNFYALEPYTRPAYAEIITIYDTAKKAINAYVSAWSE